MISTNTNKLLYFEGLRGVAALIVVFHHLELAYSLELDLWIYSSIKNITNSSLIGNIVQSLCNFLINGSFAIYIFFFMSGYVISIKLFSEKSNEYLISACTKRYFRLMPPILGAVLLGYFLMKFDLIYNSDLAIFFGNKNEFGSFYQFTPNLYSAIKSGIWNILFTGNMEGYNGPLWTMNAEFIGSLSCFAIFGIFRIHSKRYYFYFLFLLLSAILQLPWMTSFILGFLFCDIDHTENNWRFSFAYIEDKILSHTIVSILLCIMLLILIRENPSWSYTKLPYTNEIISCVFVFIIMKSHWLRKVFSNRIMVWLGKNSFSIYLLHWPIICSVTGYLYLTMNLPRKLNILSSGFLTILIIIIASIFYTKYVDRNSIKLANKIGNIVARKYSQYLTIYKSQ